MYQLYNDDCIKIMKNMIENNVIVDAIICDLPYGKTGNKWDSIIPLDELWDCYNKLIKNDGNIILTSAEPFTSMLVMSNLKMFKYDIIWQKTISSGQLNVNRQPLRNHESVLVFYKKFGTYNEQKLKGKPYSIKRNANYKNSTYNNQISTELINNGERRAKSVITISNPRIKNGHPTQKPLALMEYLVKTYTNENDTVLDNCMGCGTTGVACQKLNRNFIGIELEKEYFDISKNKMENIDDKEYTNV